MCIIAHYVLLHEPSLNSHSCIAFRKKRKILGFIHHVVIFKRMHIFTAIILCFSISLVIAMSGLLSKPVHPDIEIFFEDEDDDDDLAYDRGYDQGDTLVIDPRTYLDPKIALAREDIGRQISAAGSVLCQPVSTSSKTAHVGKEEKKVLITSVFRRHLLIFNLHGWPSSKTAGAEMRTACDNLMAKIEVC